MGFPDLFAIVLFFYVARTQDLQERDALCSEDGCYVLHFQRKIFLEAWRSCKDQGGNLATIRDPKEAEVVKELFSKVQLRSHHRGKANIWIGLQRQPRQCAPHRPLRGFSWVTGDQDTQYTNWLEEDSPHSCGFPRCVVMPYSSAASEQESNLKWKYGACSVTVDGFLCRYDFKGMCPAIAGEGGGRVLYSTPFNLLSTLLTHLPYGTVATVPCPALEDQSVLCTQKDDGAIVWNRQPPYCSDTPKSSWCDKDNGGCHHFCIEQEPHYYCDCNEGFLLAEDGVSCFPSDPCAGAPCQFQCLPVMDGFRCACPDGYTLAPDQRGCVDADECLQSPCEQICLNAPGSFQCRCQDGYQPDGEGVCEDVDECLDNPCQHACENTLGSHVCHCHLGFAPLQEDQSRCHDINECQIEGMCEQMCTNSDGGFNCSCREGYTLLDDHYSCVEGEDATESTVYEPFTTPMPAWEFEDHADPLHPDSGVKGQKEGLSEDVGLIDGVRTSEAGQSPGTDRQPEPPITRRRGFFPHSAPTPTTDYFEDESTTVPMHLLSSTSPGGAWNWLWFSSTQPKPEAEEDGDFYTFYETESNFNDSYEGAQATSGGTSTVPPTRAVGVEHHESQGNSWLLVGLLVPLCIFLVAMVVLAVMCCTRHPVKPQSKNASDCYHWIAGAGDKAAAEMSAGGTKTQV